MEFESPRRRVKSGGEDSIVILLLNRTLGQGNSGPMGFELDIYIYIYICRPFERRSDRMKAAAVKDRAVT
jgi:hypothetical protein